jgi:hypothetical protein
MRVARGAQSLADAGTAVVVGLWVLVLLASGERPAPPEVRAPTRPTILQDDAELLYAPASRVRAGMARARSLGVHWVRLTAGWSNIAPEAAARSAPGFDATDPGAYPRGNWAPLDQAVRAARAEGIEVMIDVGFWAPRWATTRAASPAERQRWDIDAGHFAQFAEAVARRYSGRYQGLPRAIGFTVWNEPNNGDFLLPQWRRSDGGWVVASARVYRGMIQAAVPAIRRAAPGSLVLIGGTFQAGFTQPKNETSAVPPLRFLRELACVNSDYSPRRGGDCTSFRPLPGDGWAHHPYAPTTPPGRPDPAPDNVRVADLQRLTDALARLRQGGRTESAMDVWVTEFAYETNPPDPTQFASPQDQLQYLAEAEFLAWGNPRVRSWAQFLLRDLNPVPGRSLKRRWSTFQSGLEFVDGRPKPARDGFRTPLVVRPAGPGRLTLWAHIRPGSGRRELRVSVQAPDGAWRPLVTAMTDPDGYFTQTLPTPGERLFRVEVRRGEGWEPGPPVTAAPPAGG